MIVRAAFGALTILSLAACATTPAEGNVASNAVPVADTASTANVKEQGDIAVATAEPVQAKKVCKSTQVIGSKFKKRICATKEEWDRQEAAVENTNIYIRKSVRSQTGQDGT